MKLPFPDAALKQHMVLLGKTGAGKSSAMRDIVEFVLEGASEGFTSTHVPVCIIDPKGDWWGLKSSKDGKKPGYPIAIFGGEHADMPLTPRSGTALAEVVVSAPFPCLIDLGGWMIGERTRFFIDFASTYFKRARGQRFLFIDEVHNFVPKGKIPDPDTGKMLHWGNRLASEGRGKGITIVAASQRPQKVHNDFLTSMETLVAMRVIHKADRNAYKDWIDGAGDMALGKQVLDTVADLKRGSAWVWSPEINFGPQVVQFPMFTTYDSFKPQQADAKEIAGRADVDLEQIKQKFAAFVQEAEQNDPKVLRKRIVELETALSREKRNTPVTAEEIDGHRRQGFDLGYKSGFDEAQRQAELIVSSVAAEATSHAQHVIEALKYREVIVSTRAPLIKLSSLNSARVPGNPPMNKAQRHEFFTKMASDINTEHAVNFDTELKVLDTKGARAIPWTVTRETPEGEITVRENPSGLRLRILGALRWLEDNGIQPAPRAAVGALADCTADKGYGARTIGELRTEALVRIPRPGTLELTDEGRILTPEPPAYSSLYDAWQARLSGLQREVLGFLRSAHPAAVSREYLGKQMGKQFDCGYGARVLGELKTMGAIHYPQPGTLQLTKHVMP